MTGASPAAPSRGSMADMKRIAIVTGASSGLGAAFARELDRDPVEAGVLDELWLVARRADLLEQVAGGLSRLRPRVVALDLCAPGAAAELEALVARELGPDDRLALLVNNAGLGTYGTFVQTGLERQLAMVDLNVRVLMELCWRLVPFMGPGSRLVNVGSLAGCQPLGNFAVYGASKAFVRSFSTALAAELQPAGIKVCTLNPGSVQSDFARVASAGARQEVLHGYPAEPVVRACLRASRKGRWACMPRLVWKLKALAGALAGPSLSALFTARLDRRPSAEVLPRGPRTQQ